MHQHAQGPTRLSYVLTKSIVVIQAMRCHHKSAARVGRQQFPSLSPPGQIYRLFVTMKRHHIAHVHPHFRCQKKVRAAPVCNGMWQGSAPLPVGCWFVSSSRTYPLACRPYTFGLKREAELSNQRYVAQLSANRVGVIAGMIMWDIQPQVSYNHPCVTVLFSDIVGFTTLSTTLTPKVRSFT